MENLSIELNSFILYYGLFALNLTVIAIGYLFYNKLRYDSFFFSLKDLQYENLLEKNKALVEQLKNKELEIQKIQEDSNELSKIILNKIRGD